MATGKPKLNQDQSTQGGLCYEHLETQLDHNCISSIRIYKVKVHLPDKTHLTKLSSRLRLY